tara:strand:- start:364 stop:756 length:393 start_codon:yes stop_codon:yes gene_type:complete
MNVILTTLVDITETKARRGDDKFKLSQQANYMTMLQTAGLRINPNPISLKTNNSELDGLGFGTSFTGKQNYWTFKFNFETEAGVNLDLLQQDFDLVPVLSGLEETVKFQNSVFRTKDKKHKNIIFELSDE